MHPDLVALGLALGVGLLVGFERERHPDTVAGVRTFGFAGLIGGLSALLTPDGSTPWVLAAVAVLLGAAATAGGIVVAGRGLRAELEDRSGGRAPRAAEAGREPFRDIGMTTALALVATTLLGGYTVLGDRAIAVAAAGVMFLLLYIRDPLHALIRRLGQEDVRAIATFVLIALVILPVMPDRTMGPLQAVNPRSAWMLVVLVVAISLAGYIAQVMLGARAGTAATGVLGGLVSSTAATVGAARRARDEGSVGLSAAVILLACGVLPMRLMVLVGVAGAEVLRVLWPWLAVIGVVTAIGGWRALRGARGLEGDLASLPKPKNPTQLRSAIAFAGVFVLIRLLTKGALAYLGMGAFLAVAAISGITDMDAIALSSAREAVEGILGPADAARGTLLALLVNTVFKLVVARTLGSKALYDAVLPALGVSALVAAVGVFVV
ncbi:MAG: MgtC/SapB family protein [Phycisphaerales bacterium]